LAGLDLTVVLLEIKVILFVICGFHGIVNDKHLMGCDALFTGNFYRRIVKVSWRLFGIVQDEDESSETSVKSNKSTRLHT